MVIFLRGGSQERVLALGSEHHTYLRLEYIYRAHREMPYEAYRNSTNLVARLNLPNMRHAPEQRVEVYHHAVQGLLTLEPDPAKRLRMKPGGPARHRRGAPFHSPRIMAKGRLPAKRVQFAGPRARARPPCAPQ